MRYCFNRFRTEAAFERRERAEVREFHRSLPGYASTPLHECPALARWLGVARLYVKDESSRFGLNAFKILGASWAMHRARASSTGAAVFAAATDGNHGRAVAWMARGLGCAAVIFVPDGMAAARRDAIRGEGARVVVVDGCYDEAVRRCASESAAHGWQVISDTGYEGYLEIPEWVVDGYGTLFDEVGEAVAARALEWPDIVLVQAGVGGLLSAAVRYFRALPGKTAIVSVEPDDADCLLASISSVDGSPRVSAGTQRSIMSGLNCGEVSLAAWPVNRAGVDLFISIEDRFAEDAMRRLYRAADGDPRMVAGESGAAGLAGLIALCEDGSGLAGFAAGRVVLVINTEGATDPEAFARVVA